MRVEIIGPYYPPGNITEKVREIKAGRKKLTLAVLPRGHASCRVDNTRWFFRRKGEITAVFQAAKQILEEEAKEYGEIRFELETSNEKMKMWLNAKGAELFNFEITPTIDDPLKVHVETTIKHGQ